METWKTRSEELGQRIDVMERETQKKMEELSKQMEDLKSKMPAQGPARTVHARNRFDNSPIVPRGRRGNRQAGQQSAGRGRGGASK